MNLDLDAVCQTCIPAAVDRGEPTCDECNDFLELCYQLWGGFMEPDCIREE